MIIMKLFLMFLFLFSFSNCYFTYGANTKAKPVTGSLILSEKVDIKVIVYSKSIEYNLENNLYNLLWKNPNIQSVEVLSERKDEFYYGNYKNTLIVRLHEEDVEKIGGYLPLLTLAVYPLITVRTYPVSMQYYDEKGNIDYYNFNDTPRETEILSWLVLPLLPVNLFTTRYTQKSAALSSIYYFLNKDKDPSLAKNIKSTEKLTMRPGFKKAIDDWRKEYEWREKFTQKEKSEIDSETNMEILLIDVLLDNKTTYARYYRLQKLIDYQFRINGHDLSVELLERMKIKMPNKKEDIQELINIINEKDNAAIINPGSGINSTEDDYLPNPEVSGRKIYFTSSDRKGGSGGEDVWESSYNEESRSWMKASPVSELNDGDNQSPEAISSDGTEMSIWGHYKGHLGGGDIYKSRLTSSGWKSPVNFDRPINSEFFDSDSCFSANGNAILFASDRPGGYFKYKAKSKYYAGSTWGNTDIYVSLKKEDGSYSTPINLGPIINTPGAERTPFLHPDGKTLYFSSEGHNGFGKLDIFKTVRLDDTWQNWSKPINLGIKLNSHGVNWGFRVTASSDRGYYTSEREDSIGKEDIYEIIPLPQRAKPVGEVAAVFGKITDENNKPAEANIEWQVLKTGETIGRLKSKPTTGEYYITLPVGDTYAYYATINGYLNQSQIIDLSKDKKFREVKEEMKLISIDYAIKKGTEITLNNILFEAGKDKLRSESFAELNRLIKVMNENPLLKIEIQGHSSLEPGISDDLNTELSRNRAEAVSVYLLSKGITRERLRSKGYGSSKPAFPNDSEENRIKNRRVSFVVLKD